MKANSMHAFGGTILRKSKIREKSVGAHVNLWHIPFTIWMSFKSIDNFSLRFEDSSNIYIL